MFDLLLKPPSGGGGGTGSLLLDSLASTIKGAWSVRKLRSVYGGAAIRVSDGSAQTDVGFDGSGNLNLTALGAAASGGKTLRVVTFYDQSGHGLDMTNAASNAPTIVSGGTTLILATTNRPTLAFSDGNPDQLLSATGAISLTSQAYAFFGVVSINKYSSGDFRRAISMLGASASYDYTDGGAIPLMFGTGSSYMAQHGANDSAASAARTPGTFTADQFASIYDGSHCAITVNGTNGTPTPSAPANITWPARLSFGIQVDYQHRTSSPSSLWDGGFSECIMIDGAVASGDQAAARSSQRSYFGTN